MSELRQVFFDTETTGLNQSENRIVEIGCVVMRNRRLVDEQRWYLNPDRDSEPGALDIHGLTTEFLSNKPRFPQIADDLIAMLRDCELIIHNASFDVAFIDMEFERAGRPERVAQLCRVVDTVKLAKQLHPGQRASLDALCKRYHVDNSHRDLHGALLDARLLSEVYLAMTGGQATLGLASETGTSGHSASVDMRRLFAEATAPLKIIVASEEELIAHSERIAMIAKKSGKQLWPADPSV